MELNKKEEIKEAVRNRYGKIAQMETPISISNSAIPSACCNTGKSSTGKEKNQSPCCGTIDMTTKQMSIAIGYSMDDLKDTPEDSNMGLGCGNPVALASLKTGETVLDLGSGGGFDCFLATKHVGDTGYVIGVDMTPEMISKARKNIEKVGAKNVEFRLGEIENIPVADNQADIIMSNCVINLSPDKSRVFKEAYRVLKKGGRLAISDIVAIAELPEVVRNDLNLLSACVGGAAAIDDTEKMLKEAGFSNISIHPKESSRDIIQEWVPNRKLEDFVVSANIEAIK